MNCYAGTSEQNGHMKETSKPAYSYIQWKVSIVSFLSLPWKLLTNVWVCYDSNKYHNRKITSRWLDSKRKIFKTKVEKFPVP
jgi:lipopolysaccharide biosynthesis glycosyltransferase